MVLLLLLKLVLVLASMLNSAVRIEERKGEKQEQSLFCLVHNVGNAKGQCSPRDTGMSTRPSLSTSPS